MVGVTAARFGVADTIHHRKAPPGYRLGRYRLVKDSTGYESAKERQMTDTNDAVITEALSVIDKALAQMMRRELVSSGEVTDVLLDVRTLLTLQSASTADA
jgi:hypothetical protein